MTIAGSSAFARGANSRDGWNGCLAMSRELTGSGVGLSAMSATRKHRGTDDKVAINGMGDRKS